MYNTDDLNNIQTNGVFKNYILVGLVILLIISVLASYLPLIAVNFDGTELGSLLFLLFLISTVPILINYYSLVFNKFGLMKITINSVVKRYSNFFVQYYTSSLIAHSILFTITIGLVFTHMLLLMPQSTYCVIFMLILGLIWIIEYIFWILNWPLYPKRKEKTLFLYWIHWSLVFGLLIGLPFHVGTWNLFWMIVLPLVTFVPLMFIIVINIREIRYRAQQDRKIESRGF